MKVLAFGASNSRESINSTLAAYAAGLVDNGTVELLDIHDYELPIYSVEREKELGQPALAKEFFEKMYNGILELEKRYQEKGKSKPLTDDSREKVRAMHKIAQDYFDNDDYC